MPFQGTDVLPPSNKMLTINTGTNGSAGTGVAQITSIPTGSYSVNFYGIIILNFDKTSYSTLTVTSSTSSLPLIYRYKSESITKINPGNISITDKPIIVLCLPYGSGYTISVS